ncbi:MAG TPA: D-glycerate dehydrogenase [Synechococcales cyanobacterium M55_K2018_004]|nr:D-glycerate dehydrogenase [Synechococcales cyanobacterium M55_K2018_004]
MTLPTVFITRPIPASLDALSAVATVEVWTERQPPPVEVLREKMAIADGLLCLLTDRIDRALLQASPQLKVISQMAVGYDNIDIAAATERGIPVGHTPGVLTNATADFTWALLMAAARRVVEGDRFTRAGLWQTWEPDLLLGPEVSGATLGIVGLGRIGQAVARRAIGFNMRVLYCGQHPSAAAPAVNADFVSFETLLQTADFVSLHVPLTPETYHLIDDRAFSQMKPSAILVNTARGGVVDQAALFRALSQGQIAAAAIDVTDPEPLPMDSPLLTLDNLIITPHLGSASQQTRTKMAQMAIANLIAGLQGSPLPHCVNPEVYHACP